MNLKIKLGIAAAVLLGIAIFSHTGSGHVTADDQGITADNWTCEALVQPTIESSQKHDLTVLEITNPREFSRIPGKSIDCNGDAEWSQSVGNEIRFGAHVSEGGQIILEYAPMGSH